jgi:hypothetical protein
VTLLKRSVAVEIERDWVRPLDCTNHHLQMVLRSQLAPAPTSV